MWWRPGDIRLHTRLEGPWSHYMILEVIWDGLWTLSIGLSQFHGHGSWLVCEVVLEGEVGLRARMYRSKSWGRMNAHVRRAGHFVGKLGWMVFYFTEGSRWMWFARWSLVPHCQGCFLQRLPNWRMTEAYFYHPHWLTRVAIGDVHGERRKSRGWIDDLFIEA